MSQGAASTSDTLGKRLLAVTLVAFAGWEVLFLMLGPSLPIIHDEVNFLYEALRLPAAFKLAGYAHGPLLYELIALVESGWYIILKLTGAVSTPIQFLTHVLVHQHAHLVLGRALVGLTALALLVQVYRLGRLFGGCKVGALAAFLCATNLTFIALASVVKEEILFSLLMITALLETWRVTERRNRGSSFVCGIVVGAAIVAKYFGLFALALCALPLLRAPRGERGRAIELGVVMLLGACTTVTVLMPFLITDTHRVLDSFFLELIESKSKGGGLTFLSYFFLHLPNLVGWIVLPAGLIEFALRLIREPRGAVLLALVPFLQMLFLGLRPGYSIAYYVFPLALLLCILASSLAIRMSRIGRWGFLVPFFLGLVAVSDGAFLRGSIKHALILTAPDTRLLARDYLYTRATPGDNILLTHAIGGMNFWGPPLLPQDPPRGTGAFAIASREALRFSEDPRYHLRVVDGFPGFTPDVTRDCDWVIAIGTGPTSEDVREGNRPPQGFELATAIQGVPPQSNFWPFLKSSDYEALHKLSVRSLWRDRVRGLPVMIYKRLDVRGKGEIALR